MDEWAEQVGEWAAQSGRWVEQVSEWLRVQPDRSTLSWWSEGIDPVDGWGTRSVAVHIPAMEAALDTRLVFIPWAVIIHPPWDYIPPDDWWRIHVEPDLWAFRLVDDAGRGLLALEVAPVGIPLQGEALERLTAAADEAVLPEVQGLAAFSAERVSRILAHWSYQLGHVNHLSFQWDPTLAPESAPDRTLVFGRIWVSPDRCGGAPCINGTRIPVQMITDLLEDGYTPIDVLSDYPDLSGADIDAAIEWNATMSHLAFPRHDRDEYDIHDGLEFDDGDDDER